MDMDYVPVISVSFGGYEHYSGFKIMPKMLFTGLRSLIYGDMLLLLKNQCLPYEARTGGTLAVVHQWIAELTEQFRRGQGLSAKDTHLHVLLRDSFYVRSENNMTTAPSITRIIPVTRFNVLGSALFANRAAILAQIKVNTTHSENTVQRVLSVIDS